MESQLTENNHAPSAGVQVGCEQGLMPRHGRVPNAPADGVCMFSGLHGEGDGQFQVRNALFGATYCISLRARRTSDQVVSAIWSAPACFTTGPAPAFPTAPTIDASYYGAIATGGAPQHPSQVRVTIGGGGLYAAQTVFFNNQQDYNSNGGWTYQVKPGDDLLNIRACWTNLAGQNCSSEVISIAQQTVVEMNGKRIVHTGRPKGGVQGPVPASPPNFTGNWHVSISSGGTYNLSAQQFTTNGLIVGNLKGPSPQDSGTIRATSGNTANAHVTVTGGVHAGLFDITLAADGNSFTGGGKLTSGMPVTWRATRF
jgi:hypothetical protein